MPGKYNLMTREEMDKFIADLRTYDEGCEPADGWWVAYTDLQKAADALEWFKNEFIESCKGQHEIELRLSAEKKRLEKNLAAVRLSNTHLNDRYVPCPDHRDKHKTGDECLMCQLERVLGRQE